MARRFLARDFVSSLNFTGTNGVTTAFVPSLTAFSVAYWVNKNKDVVNSRFIDWQDAGPLKGFTFVNDAVVSRNTKFTVSGSTDLYTGILPVGAWYHIVGTYQNVAGTYVQNLYVNRVLTQTATSSAGVPATPSGVLKIGNRVTSTSAPAESKIDQVVMANRVLTQAEIDALYFDGSIPSNSSLIFQFNEGSGSVAIDSSGNGNNGAISGATYSTDVPIKGRTISSARSAVTTRRLIRDFGTALFFNGPASSNLVSIGSTATFGIAASVSFSASAWIKQASNGQMCVFATGAQSGVQTGFKFFVNTTGGINVTMGDGSQRNQFASNQLGAPIIKDVWHHICFSADRVADLVTFYIDGNAIGTPISIAAYHNSVMNAGVTPNIGGTNNVAWFNGVIDDFCLYIGSALSAVQINSMYINGKVPTDNLVARYKFDEGSGTTAIDSSGNGNNGIITAATYTTDVPIVARTKI